MNQRQAVVFLWLTALVGIIVALLVILIRGIWEVSTLPFSSPPSLEWHPEDLQCYSSPSGFLRLEGWHLVSEVDRYRIANLAGEGKATIKLEQSLICHDFRDGKGMVSYVMTQWWYKEE